MRRRVLRPLEGRAQALVDDLHAVLVGTLERGNDDVGAGTALAAEHPVGAERDLGRHTGDAAGAGRLGAHDACHVRAVAVAVIRIRIRHGRRAGGGIVVVADEVVAVGDLVARAEAAAEIGMVVVDAGVDHGDLDALAFQAKLGAGDVHAGLRDGSEHVGADFAVLLGPLRGLDVHHRVDRLHAGQPFHAADVALGQFNREAVPERVERVPLVQVDARCTRGVTKRLLLSCQGPWVVPVRRRASCQFDEPARLNLRLADGDEPGISAA